jgi:hypothetical protein
MSRSSRITSSRSQESLIDDYKDNDYDPDDPEGDSEASEASIRTSDDEEEAIEATNVAPPITTLKNVNINSLEVQQALLDDIKAKKSAAKPSSKSAKKKAKRKRSKQRRLSEMSNIPFIIPNVDEEDHHNHTHNNTITSHNSANTNNSRNVTNKSDNISENDSDNHNEVSMISSTPLPATSMKELRKLIQHEKNAISWVMGHRLNKQLRKLALLCASTRESYYIAQLKRGKKLPINEYPCTRCTLPLSAHKVAVVCKCSLQTLQETSIRVKDRDHCGICGHDVSLHKPSRSASPAPDMSANASHHNTDNNIGLSNGDYIKEESPQHPCNITIPPITPVVVRNISSPTRQLFTSSPVSSSRVSSRNRISVSRYVPEDQPEDDDSHNGEDDSSSDSDSYSDQDVSSESDSDNTPSSVQQNKSPLSNIPSLRKSNGACMLSYEEITGLCKSITDYTTRCTICGSYPNHHIRYSDTREGKVVNNQKKIFKMPAKEQFPTFRDPRDQDMSDPRLFFRKLVRRCEYHSVPEEQYFKVLVAAMPDDTLSSWVEEHLVKKGMTWVEAMEWFTYKHTDTQLQAKLLKKLNDTYMKLGTPSYEYFEEYTTLLNRLGYSLTARDRIIDCERGLTDDLRKEVARFRGQQEALGTIHSECQSIQALRELVAKLERGLVPLPRKEKASHHNNSTSSRYRNYKRKNDDYVINNVDTSNQSTSQTSKQSSRKNVSKKTMLTPPSINNIENANGNPHSRSYGKNVKTPYTPSKNTRYSGGSSKTKCSHCGRTNHTSNDCRYPNGCPLCHKQGHSPAECKEQARVFPRMNNINMLNELDTAIDNNTTNVHKQVSIRCSKMGSHSYTRILLDTGSQVTAVSASLVKKYRIEVHQPPSAEPQYLSLADVDNTVKRVGYVILMVDICLHDNTSNNTCKRLEQRFEVINTSYDFLLGIDVLPSLFPNDRIMSYLMQPNKRQTLVYSCNTSNVALSSIDCIDNYLIDRESEIITERLIKSFDNELLNFHDNSNPSIGIDNYMTSQDYVKTLYNPDVLNIELDILEDERVVKLPSPEQQ